MCKSLPCLIGSPRLPCRVWCPCLVNRQLLEEPACLRSLGQVRQSQAEREEHQGPAAGQGLVMNLGLCRLWLKMTSGEDLCKGAQARRCPWGLAFRSPYSTSSLDGGTAEKSRDPCLIPRHAAAPPTTQGALSISSSMSGAAPLHPLSPDPRRTAETAGMRATGRPNGRICTLALLWALSWEGMEASEGTSWSPGPTDHQGSCQETWPRRGLRPDTAPGPLRDREAGTATPRAGGRPAGSFRPCPSKSPRR